MTMEADLKRLERDRARLAALLGVNVKKLALGTTVKELESSKEEFMRIANKVQAMEPKRRRRGFTETQHMWMDAFLTVDNTAGVNLASFRSLIRDAQQRVSAAAQAAEARRKLAGGIYR